MIVATDTLLYNLGMNRKQPNYILLALALILLLLGLAFLANVSGVNSQQIHNDVYFDLKNQIILGVLPGLFFFLLFYYILDYRKLKKFALIALIINFVLLLLCFVPFLQIANATAARWIAIGNFSFQPSEFLKITFILFLASWLSSKSKDEIKNFKKTTFPFLILFGLISIPIALQPSTSPLVILGGTALVMAIASGVRFNQIFIIFAIGAIVITLLITVMPGQYRKDRIQSYLRPPGDQTQMGQSLISIGSGGLWGLGFGKSVQKHNYVPESSSDSIFAIVAEELGFIGVIGIILLFFLFLLAGFQVAKGAPDDFGKYLAIGLTTWIVWQAFVNIGVSCGAIPMMGLPLPFFSAGGTALMVTLGSLGILANISKQN